MKKKSVEQVIQRLNEVIKQYDDLIIKTRYSWLDRVGKEGLKRKQRLVNLIDSLGEKSVKEAIVTIYDNFYTHEKHTSRLVGYVEDALRDLLEVPPPKIAGNVNAIAMNILQTRQELNERIEILKREIGIFDNQNSIMLSTLKKY